MASDTALLRRPPGTCDRPPNGPITISDLSGYANRRCGVTRLAREGYSGMRPFATATPLVPVSWGSYRPNWLAREYQEATIDQAEVTVGAENDGGRLAMCG